jgi:hypothetical protein
MVASVALNDLVGAIGGSIADDDPLHRPNRLRDDGADCRLDEVGFVTRGSD